MQQSLLSIEEVKSQFDHWRSTRTKRSQIPIHLWNLVKQMTNHYSLSLIAKTLGLNTKQIRNSLDTNVPINFIEVSAEDLAPSSPFQTSPIDQAQTCCIELHRASGGMLKISTFPVASLSTIITKFME